MLHKLDGEAAKVANNPANYRMVQHALEVFHQKQDNKNVIWKGRDQFNGFFFALSSRVKAAAFSAELLFDPKNFNFDQVRLDLDFTVVYFAHVCLIRSLILHCD